MYVSENILSGSKPHRNPDNEQKHDGMQKNADGGWTSARVRDFA